MIADIRSGFTSLLPSTARRSGTMSTRSGLSPSRPACCRALIRTPDPEDEASTGIAPRMADPRYTCSATIRAVELAETLITAVRHYEPAHTTTTQAASGRSGCSPYPDLEQLMRRTPTSRSQSGANPASDRSVPLSCVGEANDDLGCAGESAHRTSGAFCAGAANALRRSHILPGRSALTWKPVELRLAVHRLELAEERSTAWAPRSIPQS